MIANNLKKTEELFSYNLEGCRKLAKNLEFSFKEINKIKPFNELKLAAITEKDKESLDAFIFRFGKLQDMMGNKLFRFLLILKSEEVGFMLDTLNKMEKFYIIDSVDEWISIRDARNDAIHDYDLKSDKIVEKLNNITNFVPKLFQVLERLEKYSNK